MNLDNCTMLVCSCDSYEDTWYPFFKLLKKYWPNCNMPIILNTETKTYQYEGLRIKCLKKFKNKNVPYGERMIAHIKEINTPYTIVMMDDFFLKRPVNEDELVKVINWMENDPRAVVFSFQAIKDDLNKASEKYLGYNKRPVYGEYKFNFQAAVWKTDYLLKSWKKHETPWEWETIANCRSFTDKYDFYSIQSDDNTPIDYGFKNSGMGVYRGKWVLDSVEELFKENDIDIDFTKRGLYTIDDKKTVRMTKNTRLNSEIRSIKSLGIFTSLHHYVWRIIRQIKKLLGFKVPIDWIDYKRQQTED